MKNLKLWKKLTAVCLTVVTAAALAVTPMTVKADSEGDASTDSSDLAGTYVSLGADLSTEERATVLGLLGLTESDLNDCTVLQVTNADEHEYLDQYIDSSLIGSRALSSVKVVSTEDGSGVNVETHNITYCTTTMYQNALVTAGIKNADVTVAGPFNVSGTAGLIGAIKAYDTMTGSDTAAESVEAATQELVTTSDLGAEIEDPETAAALVGAVKEMVVSEGLASDDEINEAVDEISEEMNVDLTDEQKTELLELMGEVKNLDLDPDTLQEQAKDLYQKLEDIGIDFSKINGDGLIDKIAKYAKIIWHRIFG